MPLRKCLVANRGEIAIRIMRACAELDMQTVAVYSEADAQAQHAVMADESYLLGPAAPFESYLHIGRLIAVAQQAGCDCVHPGYGFLSESEAFAAAVIDAGLTWVGPGPDAIRRMGVKTEARALMQAAGVPVVPGFHLDGETDADFRRAASEIGFPIMVKAAGGGGGKGIRIVHDPALLPEALAAARREADHAFGDPRLFLEKYVEAARHIEIQVIADSHGHAIHLFERECSAQRRHQKIVEESPSPFLATEVRARIGQAAVQAARAVGYVNAGTVEFIVSPDGEFYFLEMNTRLQVEHPVTEMVTGLDIVKLQFAVAAGEALPVTQEGVAQRGHAIECRVYAEDPYQQFLPAAGTILTFILPEGPGIRVDSGIRSGSEIPIHYDPLIAKIIVYDRSRAAAVARMRVALAQTVILGVTTNLPFLQALLDHPAFAAGEVHTGFIDAHLGDLLPARAAPSDAALIIAALADSINIRSGPSGGKPDDQAAHPWSRRDGFRLGM